MIILIPSERNNWYFQLIAVICEIHQYRNWLWRNFMEPKNLEQPIESSDQ